MKNPFHQRVMKQLYGGDLWQEFSPSISDQVSCSSTVPPSASATNTSGIELTADDIQGWNGKHGLLTRLASQSVEKLVLDVGVWKGQSTVNLAQALRNSGAQGCVISIDTFLGSDEHWRNQDAAFFQRHLGRPDLYEQFLNNVWHSGVSDWVIPMPMTSSDAAKILKRLNMKAAIIHIDAAHDFESVKQDILSYWDLVVPGGFLVGDDYSETWPGVVQAADEFATDNGLELLIQEPKWVARKPLGEAAGIEVGPGDLESFLTLPPS